MEVEGVKNISFFSSTAEPVEKVSSKSVVGKTIYGNEKALTIPLAKEQGTKEIEQGTKSKDEKYSWVMAEKAVENANNRVRNMGTDAKFEFNEDINRIIITITDKSNHEIVKEIPTKDTQKMLEHIHTMSGMLMDTQA